MIEETMTSLDLNELLLHNPELLKVIPTRMKTPYLCYTAIYYRRDNQYLYAYVPVSMRLKALSLHLYFEGKEFNDAYTWYSDMPYIRPPKEDKTLILATYKCLVCNSKTDNILDSTYNSLEGYRCCLGGCLEKLAR